MKHPLQAPFTDALPTPLFLRTMLMHDDAIFPGHEHSWGEFVYAFNGVVQVEVGRDKYLAPPQYGIWLPPNLPHVGFNRREVLQASLYVDRELCDALPPRPQALLVSPFMRALLERARNDTRNFHSAEHQRLLCTLLDELKETPATGTFLPASDDPLLGPILHHLEQHPQDNRSVAELAREAGTTERTLARKCRQDLNIPLSEWRNRIRIVKAIALLETGRTVESIAKEFGYSSTSAFIAMFKKLTSTTPAIYRTASR
jgi:AraC-like DNA-binding protein